MPNIEGREPGPDKESARSSAGHGIQIVTGEELDLIKLSSPHFESSAFVAKWQDELGRVHVVGSHHRVVTRDAIGQKHTIREYDALPWPYDFEKHYLDDYRGPTPRRPGREADPPDLVDYELFLPLQSRAGRRLVRKFLRSAEIAGYEVHRHEADPHAYHSHNGQDITGLKFSLRQTTDRHHDPKTQGHGEERSDRLESVDEAPPTDVTALPREEQLPAPGQEQVLIAQVAELERRVQKLEAKRTHERQLKNARQQRWREKYRDQVRQYDTVYKQEWRARKRKDNPSE